MIDLKNMEPFVELPEALSHAETQTLKAMEDLGGKFKPSASTDNFYPPSENDEWTNGMWTGEINVMYELTGKDIFRKKALEHVDIMEAIRAGMLQSWRQTISSPASRRRDSSSRPGGQSEAGTTIGSSSTA